VVYGVRPFFCNSLFPSHPPHRVITQYALFTANYAWSKGRGVVVGGYDVNDGDGRRSGSTVYFYRVWWTPFPFYGRCHSRSCISGTKHRCRTALLNFYADDKLHFNQKGRITLTGGAS